MKLELIVVPVADVDRAKDFYDMAGFVTDTDMADEGLRLIQLTPPGSSCSIMIGSGFPQAAPGSIHGLHLVVSDIEAARVELLTRGVDVQEPFHFGGAGPEPGLHPERADYGSFAPFDDPDGNAWLLQEVGYAR